MQKSCNKKIEKTSKPNRKILKMLSCSFCRTVVNNRTKNPKTPSWPKFHPLSTSLKHFQPTLTNKKVTTRKPNKNQTKHPKISFTTIPDPKPRVQVLPGLARWKGSRPPGRGDLPTNVLVEDLRIDLKKISRVGEPEEWKISIEKRPIQLWIGRRSETVYFIW